MSGKPDTLRLFAFLIADDSGCPLSLRSVRSQLKLFLGTLAVVSLAATPSIVPLAGSTEPAFAAPTLTVSALNNVAKNQTHTFSVTGLDTFTEASYNVVMTVQDGSLSVDLTDGGTALYGYAAPDINNIITATQVGFEGTKTQVTDALGLVSWNAPDSYGDFSFSISVTESAGSGTYYWPGLFTDAGVPVANSARYYKFVASSGVTWSQAEAAARTDHSLEGLRGYLARPSTWEENQFVANKINAENVWIGARRGTASGISASSDWFWVRDLGAGGPASAENGRKFFEQTEAKFFLPDGITVSNSEWLDSSGNFATPWDGGEPNGTGNDDPVTTEFYAVTNYKGALGRWNDFRNDPGLENGVARIKGFVVEYNAHELTGLDQASQTSTFRAAAAPGQVTGVTASLGLSAATLSWTAPADINGSEITGYAIEYADNPSFTSPNTLSTGTSSTSATVSALDGTVPTYFRVSATNGAGEGIPSAGALAKGNQVISWSPQTSLTLADSGLTLSASLDAGDGALSYELVDAGTTGCAVSGATLTFSSTGSGQDGCEVRPVAGDTALFNEKRDAAPVTFNVSLGTFSISTPAQTASVGVTTFTDVCATSCEISGFAAADSILVVVSASDGTPLQGLVRLGSATGLVQNQSGYQADATAADGHSELAVVGTQAQINAVLNTLQYKAPSDGGGETIGISASLAGAAYFAGTGHYYEVVTGDNKTHAQAIIAASQRTFNGLTGYLATILTEDENRFIDSKISERMVWIGGKYNSTSGKWEWITGPQDDQIAFWTGTNTGVAIPDVFAQWEPGQPDGSDVCLATNYDGGDLDELGNWDDLTCTLTKPWVVEYGGNGGEVLKQAFSTIAVQAPTAPEQVTGVTATAGNTQLVLSWSAPATGGSAITDYVIERFDASTSTWSTLADGESAATSFTVTGLANGISYSFRVSAVNLVGTGVASATFSGTPVAPPPEPRNPRQQPPSTAPAVTEPDNFAPPRRFLPPGRTPTPGTAPAPLAGPLPGATGGNGAPEAPTGLIGGRPATVNTDVVGQNEVNLQTGNTSFGLTIPQGQGSIASQGGSTELAVQSGGETRLSGSGLFPGSTVQVFLPLGGNDSREIATLPVGPDGSFDGNAVFGSRPTDPPLPIGRHVLQIASLNDAGERVIVEMAITIAQPAPAPEIDRTTGQIPGLAPGQSLATRAGVATEVELTVVPENFLTTVQGDGWGFSIELSGLGNTVEETAVGGALISATQGGQATISGNGFMPLTRADIWLYSDPTLLGSVEIDENGEFTGDVMFDGRVVPAGDHTLQIQGVGVDGFVLAANLGVVVTDADAGEVPTTEQASASVLWWAVGLLALLALVAVVWWLVRRRDAEAY